MALKVWNLSATDNFNHNDLIFNWDSVDTHDHTSGKGVQIPSGGIANGSVTALKLANNSVLASSLAEKVVTDDKVLSHTNELYKLLVRNTHRQINTNTNTTSPYFGETPVLSGVAGTALIQVVYLDPQAFIVAGKTTKLVIRAEYLANPTAPAMTTTVGLYPISTVGGAVGTITYTAGTVVTGSTIAFVSPAASSMNQGASVSFDFPAPGFYAVGFRNSAAPAANSLGALTTSLSWHHPVVTQ